MVLHKVLCGLYMTELCFAGLLGCCAAVVTELSSRAYQGRYGSEQKPRSWR